MALSSGVTAVYNCNESGTSALTDFYAVGPNITLGAGCSHGSGLISNALTTPVGNSATVTNNIFSLRVNSGDPDFGSARTFACWAKTPNWNSAPGIMSNWANGGPVQWLLFADDTTHITFQVRNKSNVDVGVRLSAPTSTNWNLFVITYDGAGTIGLSINGAAKTTNTITSVINGTGVLELGNRNGNAAGFASGGSIDIFGIWDHALSDADIALLYNGGAGTEAPFTVAPVAEFSGTPTSIIAGTQVNFTDLSTNVPTSWSWNFGSGEGTSSSQNPSHTYNTPGDYTVSLQATNTAGSDTETKTNYIHVEAPIVADFSVDEVLILEGDTVNFTDESTGDPTDWAWLFGDE